MEKVKLLQGKNSVLSQRLSQKLETEGKLCVSSYSIISLFTMEDDGSATDYPAASGVFGEFTVQIVLDAFFSSVRRV